MNRAYVFAASLPKAYLRHFSISEARCKKPDLAKLRKKQELFQQDNGIPIHLKGGPSDYVLFYCTVGLLVIGVGAAVHSTYQLTLKK